MKKFIRLAFMALVLTGTVISISSCGDDDDDTPIVNAKTVGVVHGTYTGTMTAASADEGTVEVNVDSLAKTVNIAKFPVTAIVKSVVTTENQAEALKSLTNVAFKTTYTPTLSKNLVNMDIAATTISFDIKVKDKTQKIVITIADKGVGVYNSMSKQLGMALTVSGISVDGTAVKDFKTFKYIFTKSTKK